MWKYIKGILFAIGIIIFFTVCFTIVQVCGIVVLHSNPYALLGTTKNTIAYGHLVNQISVITMIADIFVVIVIFIILQSRRGNKFKKVISLNKFEAKKLKVVIPTAVGVCLVFSIVAALFSGLFFKDAGVQKLFNNMNSPVSLIGVCIIAPIAEEILFRGVLFNYLRKRTGNIYFAVIVSAITFGVAHMNGWQGVYAGILGIFLALIYMYTGSIIGDILVHMIANTVSMFQMNIIGFFVHGMKGESTGILLLFHVLVGPAMLLLAWYFYKKQKYKKISSGYLRIAIGLCAVFVLFSVAIVALPTKSVVKAKNNQSQHKEMTIKSSKK